MRSAMDNAKLKRYGLTKDEVVDENGHTFAPLTKLRLQHPGMACIECGCMRRPGQNSPCKGPVRVALRQEICNTK